MSEKVHLPVAGSEGFQSSIAADGRRKFVVPADVKGRFARVRRLVFASLIAIWIALPLVRVGGHPLVWMDVEHQRFFLFGATFNSQDAWLTFFAITATGFVLALTTSLFGRIFCGFACPQTVFLDFVFRPIERAVEGPRDKRLRRDAGPLTLEKAARKVLKHALFIAAAFVVAHIGLSFFASVPSTLKMLAGSPAAHPEAFAWAIASTLLLYGNFAWFREQLCVVVCPYGRLQASLVDDDTLVIGYDEKRGEPRGKAHDESAGDCVDCKRCVAVCPTGIDIRNGLQLDCIGCTACIDACDEVMTKLERPTGLVRFDSKRRFSGGVRRFIRPRLAVYAVLGLLGAAVAFFAIGGRTSFEAHLVRRPGAPYVVEDGRVRNTFDLHLVNKRDETATFEITARGADLASDPGPITLEPMSDREVPIVATIPTGSRPTDFTVVVERAGAREEVVVKARMVGPAGAVR